MMKEQALRRISEIGVVPVIRAKTPKQALQAAEAICEAGITVLEVTMTVPGAVDVIRQLATSTDGEILVGAGTVLDTEAARLCLDAGAEFLVNPGLDLEMVTFAKRNKVLMVAGALTPTEVIQAWKAGSDFVKVFPCGNLGGPKYIEALRGPLPQVPLIPTGRVDLQNAAAYIRAGAAAIGVGGELVSSAALESGDLRTIKSAAKQYLEAVREARQKDVAFHQVNG